MTKGAEAAAFWGETKKAQISLAGEEKAEGGYDQGLLTHSSRDKAECGPEHSNHALQQVTEMEWH